VSRSGISFSNKTVTTDCTQRLGGCALQTAPDLGRRYLEARTDTTQQSEQTPDKKVEIKNVTVNVSGYTETSDSRGS
jgi:hypothetical protein